MVRLIRAHKDEGTPSFAATRRKDADSSTRPIAAAAQHSEPQRCPTDGSDMSAINYLSEDGSGMYARWHVPDLVPSNRAVELVFVFESPHVDELRTGLPVVG